ncbi:leucyl aminopeptidase [uncultured Paenibacillus sp.]|uniref:leucyl aminopeptidase n=1 Tax=uncultured Paenibacillus sp. TaxID=227322 RepID=UPI0028D5B2D8|nr:leucyl aminopeptidase [uncultured Paenibacillus sp.]
MEVRFRLEANAAEALRNAEVIVRLAGDGFKQGTSPSAAGAGAGFPAQLEEAARRYAEKGLFKAEAGETQLLPTLGLTDAEHAVFVGIGGSHTAETLRKAGAAAARVVKKLKAGSVVVWVDGHVFVGTSECKTAQAAQALTEGLLLGLHSRKARRKETAEETDVAVTFTMPDAEGNGGPAESVSEWERGMHRGLVFGQATCFARDLTNLPGNMLTPEMLALEAEQLANHLGLDIEVIDEWTAAEQGMGGLLGVGQGSVNPPRMIVIHYEGAPDDKDKIGLIGKGITFDTGGISLKRADGMEEMISDMGGAAAVLGAMRIIAELKPKVNVVAVVPAAENMPSDRALKPGDVLTTMSGRTVEVVNTDAEGRLVLADGLTTAIRRGATRLIDVATLTGAVMVALGDVATGAITNDDTLMQEIVLAGQITGERIWPLPSFPEYKKQIESDAADLKNSGGRHGGTITGGLFIGAFNESLPWVHLDIGGTAWLYKERGWEAKGATGVMTRTLAEFVLRQDTGPGV